MILDGKKIANQITLELKAKVEKLKIKPTFAIIQVGDIEESNKYISNKIKKADEIGIISKHFKFDDSIEENDLINKIKKLNNDFDGIIVQLPLPSHMNSQNVLDAIDIKNDIDGLSTKNMNNFYNNIQPYFCPATARGIFCLLKSYNIDLRKKIMVIGQSNLVGKPITKILSKYATEIETRDITTGINGSEKFDILVVAAGHPNLIKYDNVKENAVIIDVGINVLDNKKIQGDVDFNAVKDKVFAISPVPGGIGPLTVISLLFNLIEKFV